jgi:hypothetical protein
MIMMIVMIVNKNDKENKINNNNNNNNKIDELSYWNNRYKQTIINQRKCYDLVKVLMKEKETCRANISRCRIIKNGSIRIGEIHIKIDNTKDDMEYYYFKYKDKTYSSSMILKLEKEARELQSK